MKDPRNKKTISNESTIAVTENEGNYDIEAYERSNRELFEAYSPGGNERKSDLYQFMNPKFNQNIIDLEEEND